MTMAVLTYNSGRIASRQAAAAPGKKLPTSKPATSATMKPASGVRLSDQPMPYLPSSFGVAAM